MPLIEKKPRYYAIHTFQNQKTFYAGYNPICGEVILDLVEAKKARAVYVQFIGMAETEWEDTESYTDSNGNHHTRKVRRHATEEIIHLKQAVWTPPGGGSDGMIPIGHHVLPFRFDISPQQQLPPTFNNGIGSITYTIKSNIDRPWKYDHRIFLPVTIIPVVDMNDPKFDQEVLRQESKTMCCLCCADGPIAVTARIPSTGWCPGEWVPFAVTIDNHATKALDGVSCVLEYETVMRAQGHTKSVSKRIATQKVQEPIQPETSFVRTIYLQVPPTCPSIDTKIIDHNYVLRLIVHLPSGHFNIRFKYPVIIGTIPHAYPPLFEDQKAALAESARQAAYAWANPQAIVAAAAAANANQAAVADVEYNDAYQGDEPSYASLDANTQYAYFAMPDPNAGQPAACEGGQMPMSFGAQAQAYDIPKDD